MQTKSSTRNALGMNQSIQEKVKSCTECLINKPKQNAEPLLPHETIHWKKKIGVNLCVCNNKNNLVICDYYSNYPEVCPFKKTTSTAVIKAMKFVFAGHGIPKIIVSDNGPQFSSAPMNSVNLEKATISNIKHQVQNIHNQTD